MNISVVVPLYNEEESLPELISWITKVMNENKFSYEIIMVDDGSNDNSWKVIEKLENENEQIVGIKFRRNYGKSAALHSGFNVAKGDVVITLDADLQDSPDEIPELYKMVINDDFDVVSGWKKKRYDPFIKRVTSKLYNGTSRMVTGLKLHDMNCGLKAYKLSVVKSIEVYGEMHRYIPVLAKRAGFYKIGEKVVSHQERKYGVTKFGLERFVNGFLDLLSITFITKFGRRPMHFFGVWGTLMFLIGGFIAVWIIGEKMFNIMFSNTITRDITDQPLFYLSLTLSIIGVQLFVGGFLGELISRSSSDRNTYLIEKEI
jgi:glycosyltransferase involved in cell wall biosynthesis